ncbi:polysaccharide biosynthesis/export family protein [Methylobacterium sp. M6A4_1b]
MRSVVLILLMGLGAGACQPVAKDGPTKSSFIDSADVIVQETAPTISYALVDLSAQAIQASNRFTLSKNPAFSRGFMDRGPSRTGLIGYGDILAITIFEAASGGLFIPSEAGSRAGNFVQVPNQQVDAAGNIVVPYAGTIKVSGRTAQDVSSEIVQKLRNRAIEPQVVVSIAERRGNDISVIGEVNLPARIPLDPGGLKVLGAIARAGGPRNPAHETIVTIQRGGATGQSSLSTIVRDASQNVAVRPGDVIYVSREQKIFMVLGSTPSPGAIGGTNNRRFTFDNDNVTLAEAISKSGGLDGLRADAGAIFLLRYESREALQAMGVDTSSYQGDLIPTIHRANWTKAAGVFLTNDLYIRNKDIIYVAEHPTSDFAKLSAVFRSVSVPASDAALIGR